MTDTETFDEWAERLQFMKKGCLLALLGVQCTLHAPCTKPPRRSKMRRIFSSIVLSFALSSGAVAADFGGVPQYDDDYDSPPSYNWSGLYLGAHGGWLTGNSNVNLSHSQGAIHYNDP